MSGVHNLNETYVTKENIDDKLEGWMEEISTYQWRDTEPVKSGKIALLVVDMSKPFVDEGNLLSSPNARAVLPRIKTLVDSFRKSENPVIWIVQGHHSIKHDRGERLNAWWPRPLIEGTGV